MTERPNKRQRSESYGERRNLAGKAPNNLVKLYVKSIFKDHLCHLCHLFATLLETIRFFKTTAWYSVRERHIASLFTVSFSCKSLDLAEK